GVVHHLVDHVVEAGRIIGVADVHAGTLAYCVESLEDFDVFSGVVFCCHPIAFWSLVWAMIWAVGRCVSRRAEYARIAPRLRTPNYTAKLRIFYKSSAAVT